jgi:L-alanine-DL-glutamate epimerase-like enolase superfamily enzyme
MKISVEPITLHLKTPFRIAHGTSTARHNVLVYAGEGVGEGAIPPYYTHTQADVVAYLESLDLDALLGEDVLAPEHALDRLPPGPAPARCALDIALHDHWAKQLGQPLYRLWGLNPTHAPLSTFTLSIPEDLEELLARVQAAEGFPLLKLKLGTGSLDSDEAIVRLVRQETDARLCVDANCAWSVEAAAHIIPRLAAYDLLFVEQPIPATDVTDWHRLRRLLSGDLPPLVADESVQQASDILALAGGADGINIKLSKAGGLREARRMVTLAQTVGMGVMLGCMVESSVGITAAAHLAPLVDWADLDGNLNLLNDPYVGTRMVAGKLPLPPGPGLGVRRR